jgi:hypothetical protein
VARAALDDEAAKARTTFETKSADLADAQAKRAEETKPAIQSLVGETGKFLQQVAESRVPPLTLPPPPKPQLRAFLAPRDGQSPEATIAQLFSALTTFATMGTSLVKGNSRSALAAFTGALKGWQEGDADLADREFKRWKAETDTAVKTWESQRAAFEDWLKVGKLSLDQRTKGLELAMLQSGMELDPKRTEVEGAKYLLERIEGQQKHADALAHWAAQAEDARAAKEETARHNREMERLQHEKIAAAADDAKRVMDQYTPEVLEALGKTWFLEGKMPAGLARQKGGAQVQPMIVKAGMEWARANGIDPMSSATVRAEVGSARKALDKLRGINAVQGAAIRRFEGHADKLLELSEKVDRSGRPVLNRVILKAKGEYGGDEDTAAFEVQAYEMAMEFSRVVVGTAQGDAATRDEARKNISGALSKTQLVRVIETLRSNAERNIENNKKSEQQYLDIVDTAGGRAQGSAPASPPAAGWSIKRLD